ncbi:MAG: sigma 54-interacting transcriptional regulator, partial [bacterium]|nr:sigma 54-interacting transcriptional regulator [bacterium]
MNADELKEQLRRNLLRLWTHLGKQTGAVLPQVGPDGLRQALESLFRAQNGAERTWIVSDQTPKSKLVTALFPVGPPGLDLYRELREGDLPPDHLALAARLVIGSSLAIRQTVETALRLAPTSVPILVSGETGVGKELFARLVHQASAVAREPFVTVNCAAMPDTLLMAELFGYEPGSFTGAAPRGRIGKIEAADGGTLLLDEIGDLSATGQAALLRFLDSGEVQKVGRAQSCRVTVRLICSTNCDLERLVESGRFRKDLYYRIALVPLHVPPLRERRSDIPALTAHFLMEFHQRHRRATPAHVSAEAMECFERYAWP